MILGLAPQALCLRLLRRLSIGGCLATHEELHFFHRNCFWVKALPKKLQSIIVTVADEALKDINELADKLAAKGMKVDRVLPITGVISGSAPSQKLSSLKKVAGVSSVEKELSAELPPSDSPVQ